MTSRVAVIGAGPCGLSTLQAFATAKNNGVDIPEVVCFEKQSDWNGLWNYSWRTGTDEYGDPVHGSMYRYLWSNGPKECLEFADYTFEGHFGKLIPSFPPRAVLADYILGRANSSGLRDYVQLESMVEQVSYSDASGRFNLTIKDRRADQQRSEEFDHVIVCTGHFSVPNIPYFEGIEYFPGRVMHGHDFREAREFAGDHVLVIGASYSAEDIALQCHKYGASSVTMTYRTGAMGFKWPDTMDERPLLQKIDNKTCHFKDGSSKEFDTIIMCTGYLHHFPFLEDDLRLRAGNRLYAPGLYKGVCWQDNPKLMYIGMQDQFYTFSMFDLQGWFARDVVLGRIELPSAENRLADSDKWVAREEALPDPIAQIDFQTDYCKELAAVVDYPDLDWELLRQNFKKWEHDKEHDITTYRNATFKSGATGSMSPSHHTDWLEAMDDSMETYMNVGGGGGATRR